MQNVCSPWHKRWRCGSLQEDMCAKSSKHLCKHMAFFQACRQCSHRLKIDVQGNIPCPRAMLGWLWTSEGKKEDKEKACRFKQYPLSIFRCGSAAEENAAWSFLSDLFVSVQINHSCWLLFFGGFFLLFGICFGCKSQQQKYSLLFFFFLLELSVCEACSARMQIAVCALEMTTKSKYSWWWRSHTQLTPCRQRGGV